MIIEPLIVKINTIFYLLAEDHFIRSIMYDRHSWDPKFQKIEINDIIDNEIISQLNLLPNMIDYPGPSEAKQYFLLPEEISYYEWADIVDIVQGNGDFLEARTVRQLLTIAKILDRFCCDDDLKSRVVEKIKMKIDETNWKEVLHKTMTIPGLKNVAMAALKSTITKIERHYSYRSLSQQVEEDPWVDDYGSLPVHGIKLMLRSKFKNNWKKLHVLRNWVTRNPEHKAAVLEMLSLIDLRHELVMVRTEKDALIAMVRSWLPREHFITFTKMLVEALRQQKLRQQELETGEWEWGMGMGRRGRGPTNDNTDLYTNVSPELLARKFFM